MRKVKVLYKKLHELLLPNTPDFDMVFVVFEKSKGWILEAICREIEPYIPGKITFHYDRRNLPTSKAYFYAHYYFFSECRKYNSCVEEANNLIWFTHPRSDINADIQEIVNYINSRKNSYILVPCTYNQDYLGTLGLDRNGSKLILGAADPDLFSKLSKRRMKTIGFCSAFYERKRPDRIIGLVSRFPQYDFLLLGKGWGDSPYEDQLKQYNNLRYVECSYEEYPSHYEQMDVFVAASDLEGGPIPLVESMMSDVVPVACDTGFARDVIEHGKNGYIFPVDANLDKISELIQLALNNTNDIRATVQHLSWEYFAKQITRLL